MFGIMFGGVKAPTNGGSRVDSDDDCGCRSDVWTRPTINIDTCQRVDANGAFRSSLPCGFQGCPAPQQLMFACPSLSVTLRPILRDHSVEPFKFLQEYKDKPAQHLRNMSEPQDNRPGEEEEEEEEEIDDSVCSH
jgi:hypothetical protein